jgi:AcrR family transcriptional regulator
MEATSKRAAASQARRKLIIEAAVGCFVAQGFHQTSIRDIASAAGVSLGNLYNHFAGKAELIAEIATLEAEENTAVLERAERAGTAQKALSKFLRLYLDLCSDKDGIFLTTEIFAEALRNPEVAQGFIVNRQALEQRLARMIAAHPMAGEGLDALRRAGFVLDLIEGLAARAAFEGRKARRAERAEMEAAALALISG